MVVNVKIWKKNIIQNKSKNNYAPHLPEEKINKLVEELSDPNLLPLSRYTEE